MNRRRDTVGSVNVFVHKVWVLRLLKVTFLQINIQVPTRFSKEEQGVMRGAEKIIRGVQRCGGERGGKDNAGDK